MPSLDEGPQMELMRDVQDLNDNQLWEVLEAPKIEMARREGGTPHRLTQRNLMVPGVVVKLKWMTGKWTPDGGGNGGILSPSSDPQVPLRPMWMSADSSACLQLG